MAERWCVKHRDGWCAAAMDRKPRVGSDAVHTVCGYLVTLTTDVAQRAPDCDDCLTVLALTAGATDGD